MKEKTGHFSLWDLRLLEYAHAKKQLCFGMRPNLELLLTYEGSVYHRHDGMIL